MTSHPTSARAGWTLLTLVLCALAAGLSRSVDTQDTDRQLWDSEFLRKRPAAETPSTTQAPPTPPAYRRASPPADSKIDSSTAEVIGITLWRLRPTTSADSRDSRLLLQEDGGTSEWTPERVEALTAFKTGDRVRLSIESSRAGYLYVIDREQYADGTMSDPYLIFPTLRIRAGNNAVAAGRVVELPEGSAFRLRPMRPDYRGEQLTLLVTPQALTEVRVALQLQQLDGALVDRWERQWSVGTEHFESVGGAGKPYTRLDREAGAEGRLLTQEDGLPQSLFRLAATPGRPLLLVLPLRIAN